MEANDMKTVLKFGGIAVLILALLGVGAFAFGQINEPVAAEGAAPTVAVTRGSIQETISATGNVQAVQQASLAFETSGPIEEVLVQEGLQVIAGQVLATQDTATLEWQIVRSQASLETAQARLEQAQQPASEKDIASAQAALDSAIASLDKVRAGASAEDVASAQASLDSARANYDKVRAGPTEEDLASARASLDSAKASVQQAQAAYDRIKNQPDVAMRQESLTLQNATISLEQAQTNYDALANRPTASDLASAEAQVVQGEAQLAQLLEKPTGSELASAESQVSQAEAQLDQLLDRPNAEDTAISEAQVLEAQLALEQARDQLQDAQIVAPFAGTILTVQINEGEWANPGTPAIILADTGTMSLDVNVDEIDVAQITEGQVAHLSFTALKDQEITGTVSRVAPSSTNISGAVAYAVEISFEPGEVPVRLGMTADVEVVVAEAKDTLLVSNRAIEADREAGRYFVTMKGSEGSNERVEVQIGLRDSSQTQIAAGVKEGDQLLLPQVPGQSEDAEGSGMPMQGPNGGGFFGGGG
jgi:HlyD family secretion protein